MYITMIEKQKKNNKRFNIYIDNKYVFSASYEELNFLDLKEGKEIDDEHYNYYLNYLLKRKAENTAVKFLSYKMRTEKELQEKLKSKDFPDDIINDIIFKFKELKYIDDRYYAELYIEEKKEQLHSKYRIFSELKVKGIDTIIISDVLEDKYPDELEIIKRILYKKLKTSNDIVKIKAYLYRNGFKIDDINKVLKLEELK
ncbi:MAG: RecX family transcriptional regulator [Thermoanaerobacteraceae bacterium]|nr:RecX family transcriptional regulator [Thermoanaerobacteraceae bacterium]